MKGKEASGSFLGEEESTFLTEVGDILVGVIDAMDPAEVAHLLIKQLLTDY